MLFNSSQQAEDKLIILYVLQKIKTAFGGLDVDQVGLEQALGFGGLQGRNRPRFRVARHLRGDVAQFMKSRYCLGRVEIVVERQEHGGGRRFGRRSGRLGEHAVKAVELAP